MRLPLFLPYPGAASVEDAAGVIVAECIDPSTAAQIVAVANAAQALAEAEGGSVFAWRAALADLARAMRGAGEEGRADG